MVSVKAKSTRSRTGFPDDFIWGAAASAYQIEGAAGADGMGASVWDMMCRQPGRIFWEQTGQVSCDHYHRYREDVGLMKQMGLKAYRLSVSWPRVIPDGDGKVNPKGLDFYDRLIDELLKAGIQPWVTLFHWDFPYALYCRGGWLNRQSPEWFARYAEVVVQQLSDRVRHWLTLNEPQCFIGRGHLEGLHAPGTKFNLPEVLLLAHHALLAHGRAVQVIREHAKQSPLVGWAPVGKVYYPATDTTADIAAARQKMFDVHNPPTWGNTWWVDPVVFGHYPDDGLRLFGTSAPKVQPGDMELIRQPLDFFGVNVYHGERARAGQNGPEVLGSPDGCPLTTMPWTVNPKSLYWGPRFFYEHYKLPIVITENGTSLSDWLSVDGRVHDPQRIDFLERYLAALRQAVRDGVDVRGYFYWSVLDNFEWEYGYSKRFGLIHVDYATGRRILKDSAYWYAKVIASNGANLGIPFDQVERF